MVAALLALYSLFIPSLPGTAQPHTEAPCANVWLDYRAPVPGPVVDRFRVEDGPFGPGNRGIDFATTPGESVAAIAAGRVTFAGPVGGALWVTVSHADGLRSSYGPLVEVLVAPLQSVGGGDPVGVAGGRIHLGVRRGQDYVDPAPLLAGRFDVRLVPPARFEQVLDGGSCALGG